MLTICYHTADFSGCENKCNAYIFFHILVVIAFWILVSLLPILAYYFYSVSGLHINITRTLTHGRRPCQKYDNCKFHTFDCAIVSNGTRL